MFESKQNNVHSQHRWVKRGLIALLPMVVMSAQAGPQGGVISAGSGSIASPTAQNTIVQQDSATLSINWDSFNLAADESVQFIQPDAQSAALNFINDQQPSTIFGQINANGQVFLMNPNGMVFGESARIDVGALIAGAFQFDQASDLSFGRQNTGEYSLTLGSGAVTNAGVIQTADGGTVALLGNSVSNSGSINARLGRIHLLSADAATLSFDADGLIQFAITRETLDNANASLAAVENSGALVADGGYVVLAAAAADDVFATVVNNSGLIQATGISNRGGVVRLEGSGGNVIHRGVIDVSATDGGVGGDATLLGERVGVLGDAVIDASGKNGGGRIHVGGARAGEGPSAQFTQLASGARLNADAVSTGNGGEIIVWADDSTWSQGDISATGGAISGDGGFVEVSGRQGLVLQSDVDVRASNGNWGTLLLDPTDIVIVDQAAGGQANDGQLPDLSDATVGAGTFNIGELALEGLAASSNLILEATNDITLNNLADNVLSMATDNLGSITLTADSDGDGAGRFGMDAGDTIATQGGAVTISGAGVALGLIDTDGPGSNDGAITVTSTTGVTMGSATAGTQTISVSIDSDANGVDILTLTGSLSGGSVTLAGGGDANDTLVGPNLTNSWVVSSLNTGTLNGADFSSFPNLTGGSGDDSFAITGIGSVAGVIDGGAQTTGDSVDYSGATGLVTVTLATDIRNVEALVGGGADYTLVADDVANTWTITGQNDGSVAGLSFTDFSNLIGGSDTDDYVLNGGSVTGTINGAGGTNSLSANDTANSLSCLPMAAMWTAFSPSPTSLI
ncbi:MAG: filamentous hemagglutinin N-terminal domain-containing protein [Gammaproteobacteria bacterium]|nr:filamentous hemagglutinin N-terminal domain-containing protein [Gammaproteobacteria bacterium]